MSGAPILFDFTGNASNATSMSFLQSGLSLTVSSALYNGGNGGNQLVYEYSTPTLSMTSSGSGALSSDAFVLGTAATNADQHLIYDQASGNLYFDADGNGLGARQQVASLGAGVALTFQDVFVF